MDDVSTAAPQAATAWPALLRKRPVVPQLILVQLGPIEHETEGVAGQSPVISSNFSMSIFASFP